MFVKRVIREPNKYYRLLYSLYELRLLPPPGAQRYTSNFAKPAAKLVCRASRKRCSVWPWLGPPEPPRI